MAQDPEFKYFGWTEDPIGKYKQPVDLTVKAGSGYQVSDVNKTGVMVKGRWPSDTKMKQHTDMRGAGSAERGKKFMVDPTK